MLGFEDNCRLWLRGDDSQPMVYIEAAIWGNEGHLGYDKFTAEVTRIFNDVLGISPDCIYIRYSDIPDWGVDGMNFDRNNIYIGHEQSNADHIYRPDDGPVV